MHVPSQATQGKRETCEKPTDKYYYSQCTEHLLSITAVGIEDTASTAIFRILAYDMPFGTCDVTVHLHETFYDKRRLLPPFGFVANASSLVALAQRSRRRRLSTPQ